MDSIAPVGSVSATANAAQLQALQQVMALRKQLDVAQDVGSAALQLINAALRGDVGQSLDVLA